VRNSPYRDHLFVEQPAGGIEGEDRQFLNRRGPYLLAKSHHVAGPSYAARGLGRRLVAPRHLGCDQDPGPAGGAEPVEASWSAGSASKKPKSQSRTLVRALDPINRTSNSSSSIASTSIVAGRLSGGLSAAKQGG